MYSAHTDYTFVSGNCLFDSLAYALTHHGWDGDGMQLRELVLEAVRQGGDHVNAAVAHWVELCNLPEYRFAGCVKNEQQPLDAEQRNKLAAQMRNVNKYWGDDFSLQVLSNKLKLRVTVLRCGTAAFIQPQLNTPTHTVILALKNAHYTPVSFDDEFLVDTHGRPLKPHPH